MSPLVFQPPQPQLTPAEPQIWPPQCQSPMPIFNYIEKLQISNNLDDDLEDINNLIDTEVGVNNLQPMQDNAGHIMAQFQQQDMSNKIKVRLIELGSRNE